jgi:hypothetical protein
METSLYFILGLLGIVLFIITMFVLSGFNDGDAYHRKNSGE